MMLSMYIFNMTKKTKNIMAYVYDAYIRLKGIMKSHNVDKDDVKDKINEVLDKYKKFEKLSFSEFMTVIEILITPTNGIRS